MDIKITTVTDITKQLLGTIDNLEQSETLEISLHIADHIYCVDVAVEILDDRYYSTPCQETGTFKLLSGSKICNLDTIVYYGSGEKQGNQCLIHDWLIIDNNYINENLTQ